MGVELAWHGRPARGEGQEWGGGHDRRRDAGETHGQDAHDTPKGVGSMA
jgi:hypothetical protein